MLVASSKSMVGSHAALIAYKHKASLEGNLSSTIFGVPLQDLSVTQRLAATSMATNVHSVRINSTLKWQANCSNRCPGMQDLRRRRDDNV
jgi:hypothetical protein